MTIATGTAVAENNLMSSKYILLTLLGLVAVSLFCCHLPGEKDDREIIAQQSTLYYQILIYEFQMNEKNVRCMQFEGRSLTNQSCIDVDHPEDHVAEYTEMAFAGLFFIPEPKSVLVIGLGGGIIPMAFSRMFPDAVVDVVEIDPKIPKLSKKYFNFDKEDKINVHISDGRRFIRRSKTKYEIVILDAYRGEQVPFHLMTSDFYEELKTYAMSPKGVLVSNIVAGTQLVPKEMATYEKSFTEVYPFAGTRSGNLIVVATRDKINETRDGFNNKGRELKRLKPDKFEIFMFTQNAQMVFLRLLN